MGEGMGKVKGIIQWVEAKTAVRCTVRSYDRLFLPEDPAGDETRDGNGTKDFFLDDINPDSLKVLEGAVVEPSVAIDCMQLMAEIQLMIVVMEMVVECTIPRLDTNSNETGILPSIPALQ